MRKEYGRGRAEGRGAERLWNLVVYQGGRGGSEKERGDKCKQQQKAAAAWVVQLREAGWGGGETHTHTQKEGKGSSQKAAEVWLC